LLVLLISTTESSSTKKGRDVVASFELVDVARKARQYDPEALSRLFDIYFEKLRRYMYYKTGDIEKAEDLAAETLTVGLENIAKFEDKGGTIGAWLFGIARNMLAREREAAGRSRTVELEEDLPLAEEEQPEKLVLVKLTHEELYEALGQLPDDQREVVLLRFMEGYDVKTVAGIIGKKPGAVRALQFRAVRTLKEMFEPGGAD
jgi:RNA polymerase sigma-70 factor, ECF subfamily